MTTRTNHGALVTLERIEAALAFARPPYEAELHNPDNLTPKQVGIGYRLRCASEIPNPQTGDEEYWRPETESWKAISYATKRHCAENTYRVPLSVPWPEQPAPPPGMQWHRRGVWKAEDLPPGTRPLVEDGEIEEGDECRTVGGYKWTFSINQGIGMADNCVYRTTRPLLFQHAGHEWTWHRAGDPMPCDGERSVIILQNGKQLGLPNGFCGKEWSWDEPVIGWRYADAVDPYASLKEAHAAGKVIQEYANFGGAEEGWRDLENPCWIHGPERYRIKPNEVQPAPKQKLGPSDVPPFSLIRRKPEQDNDQQWHWRAVSYVTGIGPHCGDRGYNWEELQKDYEINRPKHRDADGNPTLWEACEK